MSAIATQEYVTLNSLKNVTEAIYIAYRGFRGTQKTVSGGGLSITCKNGRKNHSQGPLIRLLNEHNPRLNSSIIS